MTSIRAHELRERFPRRVRRSMPITAPAGYIVARCVVCSWSAAFLVTAAHSLGDRIVLVSDAKREARAHCDATGHDVTVDRQGGPDAGHIESVGLYCSRCRQPQRRAGERCESCAFRGVGA